MDTERAKMIDRMVSLEAEIEVLNDIVIELLTMISGGRVGHMGLSGQVYTPQISKARIDALSEMFSGPGNSARWRKHAK
jgi:hypothetical protein